ncbi:MAG: tRNA (adenosine(37)-N6)-threonylcarbamoyltransferase complex ATPase subunit type 1 TsaE [Candidatus Nealsonbacteria bacterium]|nr:tRNA (adenosine(37)-N6)-threonylcarbamoyltransferase complex ATPase subunit type 1 TsaE [Candidatus Nealsonbacteria bacterium]
MEIQFLTVNPFQTKKLGKILAEEILKTKPKKTALLIGLEGSLGGGKTTFLQGFARGLRIKEKILSPTFIIMRKFEIRPALLKGLWQNSEFKNFYHIDCYRIEKPKEILDLGFKEIISNPQNIVTIEWAEKIKKVLPRNTIWINFEFIDKNTRKLIIKK